MAALLGTGLWYWNHKRVEERIASQREATLREDTTSDLILAQDAMSKKNLDESDRILTRRRSILENENRPALANLYERTKLMSREVEKATEAENESQLRQQASEQVRNRYRRFLELRNEALYRDTQFPKDIPGLELPTNDEVTRKAAEAALGVFAQRGEKDDWKLGALPEQLASDQKAAVQEGFYEMLLVLAGAVAASGQKAQVDTALGILEIADRVTPHHSRAYHLRKASFLARKNDRAGEARELELAESTRPETAFDHFLSGQQEYKRQRLPAAIKELESALRVRPEHLWAQLLLANCYLYTSRFEAAKSCITGCLQIDRNLALLYVLRGFASGQIGVRNLRLAQDSSGREADLKSSAEYEFDEAEADLREAVERLKVAPDTELQYVLFVNRGLIRFQRGRLDDAALDFKEAIHVKKDASLAHANLAYVYEKQDKPALAIEQFDRAIALKPDWAPLYRGRAATSRSPRVDRRGSRSGLDRSQEGDRARAGRQAGPGPGPHQSGQAPLSG